MLAPDLSIATILFAVNLLAGPSPTSQPGSPLPDTLKVQLVPPSANNGKLTPEERHHITVRFTADDLKLALAEQVDLFGLIDGQRELYEKALDRINFEALLERLGPIMAERFSDRFDPALDAIIVPVPEKDQVDLDPPFPGAPAYRGPKNQTVGFVLYDLNKSEYVSMMMRVLHTARIMLDAGQPDHDRTSPKYYRLLAERESAKLRASHELAEAEIGRRDYIRRQIGELLGVYNRKTGQFDGPANWVKESRRFSYVVREGQFIGKLLPLVERINEELTVAGFPPPTPFGKPGIHFDPDLGDVEILLPEPMMADFLAHSDRLERRLSEDQTISIEVVRLTDRDMLSGELGYRLNAASQGVHDVNIDRNRRQGLTEYGVNSLVAVANRQLQVANLQGIESGALPMGALPLTLPMLSPPVTTMTERGTTLGGETSIGSDPRFFESGAVQRFGFSYIGPDGLTHTMSLDVADSLTDAWDRIERNLVVYKIRKAEEPIKFSVPVGPEGKIFEGIAALISEENEERVIVSENSLAKLEAQAGSWLIIRDFDIEPLPGSSTALTQDEQNHIRARVLLTMFLRDPRIDVATKERILDAGSIVEVEQRLDDLYETLADQAILTVGKRKTYESIFEERYRATLQDAAVEKKEKNSRVVLSFYSSQGAITTPRFAQLDSLGDVNDLTSFTTDLSPNMVTPISTSITKNVTGAEGRSALTGIPRGQASSQDKDMTHLLVRVRLPTEQRQQDDRAEGRYLGNFDLPLSRTPHSTVDVPFVSSSNHPLERLSKLRPGLMFASLQPDRVRKPFQLVTIERTLGTVTPQAYNASTARMLLMQKLIADSPSNTSSYAPRSKMMFVISVRSLLEYDEDFFNVANVAMRNMSNWNDPERIFMALNHSNHRFALDRLIGMIDELGEELLPDDYIDNYVALSPSSLFGPNRVNRLTTEEVQTLRRDVANHYMRFLEIYGDSFMEAVSIVMDLGSYRTNADGRPRSGPFNNYRDLVVFDRSARAMAKPELLAEAHEEFLFLLDGGYKGKLFEKSVQGINDMTGEHRKFVLQGHDILREYSELRKPSG